MNDDKNIWHSYKAGLAPLAVKKVRTRVVKSDSDKNAARKAAMTSPPTLPKSATRSGLASTVTNAMERKREKSIRDGSIDIDARLDLHGMTQAQAFAALTKFMQAKNRAGNRHLLIITGKGKDNAGVLRTNLQNWLGQLPEASRILALRSAAAKHGGSGAYYVILRKQ